MTVDTRFPRVKAWGIRLAPFLVLILLPLLWFWPVVLGGKTLLPADNLYTFFPWKAFATQMGVTVPHNELLSDLILENYAWKTFLRENVRSGVIPLWNPYLFSGMPFLAEGQHSGLYPLSVIYYVLPLPLAYGVFTWLQLALAGMSMYALVRMLGLSRWAGVLAGVAYQFSGFFIVSVVFPMILAAASWLPLLLGLVHVVFRKQREKGPRAFHPTPYVVALAAGLALLTLAGHVEILYDALIVLVLFGLWEWAWTWRTVRSLWPPTRTALWLMVGAALGLGMGAIQFLPLYELVRLNFREGSATLAQVLSWAWPTRHVLTFFLPDVFGNPAHHRIFDPWTRSFVPVTVNALGERITTPFWGIKNYVEGGNYLGLLTWFFAAIAVGQMFLPTRGSAISSTGRRRLVAFWLFLALLSLSFAFGLPTYALLYYGLPGYRQLHSPFRWVWPFTLSMGVLAAFGLDAARHWMRTRVWPRWLTWLGWSAVLGWLGVMGVVVLSLFWPGPFVRLADRVLAVSDLARRAFPNGRLFWAYEWGNLVKLGWALLTVVGVWWGMRRVAQKGWRDGAVLAAAVGLLFSDLWLIGGHFNPAVDPRLLSFTPPSIRFLQEQTQDQAPWRFTTFEVAGKTTKTLNANSGWWYHLQDVRGYDSIIPKQYVMYMEAIEPQGQLLYNRISPFFDPASLTDPRTHLLGVRYVVTEVPLDVEGYRLVYEGEVRIYENERAFPRAFLLTCDREAAPGFPSDPARGLWVDRPGEVGQGWAECVQHPARVVDYGINEVHVEVQAESPAWLVLTDAYFPGWKAYYRSSPSTPEVPLRIWRADGNFRAVALPPGTHQVRFKYSPMSFKLGLYLSFLSAVAALLLLGFWAWGRYYREPEAGDEVKVVAKNSLIPMGMNILNRFIDFAFAMLRLRILSPGGEGAYAFAIAFYGFFEILVRFGLGSLITRDVAQDKSRANVYLSNTVVLRTLLWVLSLPIQGLIIWAYVRFGHLSSGEVHAIGLFTVALLFAAYADAISSLFYAWEKMEYPAGVATVIVWLKVSLGALVLLMGGGFVGLAAVALLMNIIQTLWLYRLLRQTLFRPRWEVDWQLQRWMVYEAGPLMINHLLATIFFRIDMWILRPVRGEVEVGWYSAAYKYLDGLNVIPAYFSLALFPLMSRYAHDPEGALARAYRVSLRLLIMAAIPIVVFVLFAARFLIQILGGAAFLPHSAWALQLLILSIPIGFVNSLTQYALIAVGQQRFLTRAFIIGVLFNILSNLLLIPRYGYQAAAVTTILSELALLVPFYYGVRRYIAPLPWLDLYWRPLVAGGAMAGVMGVLWPVNPLLAVSTGFGTYLLALVVLRTFAHPDLAPFFTGRRLRFLRWLTFAL
ncbi:MAG: oligosaccharide flippase family protein [Chloroflexi bacterium]|nr:oligosaccharide flippase family protein [Chloroflexota bacterium]